MKKKLTKLSVESEIKKQFFCDLKLFRNCIYVSGFFPYTVTKHKIKLSWYGALYSILVFSGINAVCVLALKELFNNGYSSLQVLALAVYFISDMVVMDMTLLLAFLKISFVNIISKDFIDLDVKLRSVDIRDPRGPFPKVLLLFILGHLSFRMLMLGLETKWPYGEKFGMCIRIMIPLVEAWAGMVPGMVLGLVAYALTRRFNLVNNALRDIYDEVTKRKPTQIYPVFNLSLISRQKLLQQWEYPNETKLKIRVLQTCHYDLIRMGTRTKLSSIVPLTVIVISVFIRTLTEVYLALKEPVRTSQYDWNQIFATCKWSALEITKLISMTSSFLFVTSSSRQTGSIVHQLMLVVDDVDVKKELKTFSLQLLHHQLDPGVFGLYVLDFSLLLGIFSGLTTYLVIALFNFR